MIHFKQEPEDYMTVDVEEFQNAADESCEEKNFSLDGKEITHEFTE